MKKLGFYLSAVFLLNSCFNETEVIPESTDEESSKTSFLVKPGNYLAKLEIGNGKYIPFNFACFGDSITIINSSEKINVSGVAENDTLHLDIPVFDSELILFNQTGGIKGAWFNYAKEDYSIPVTVEEINKSDIRFNHSTSTNTKSFQGKWEVNFLDGNNEDSKPYKAIGVFEQYDYLATGTFITETGDYRFLQGNVYGDTLSLSCFDGAHAFLFEAYYDNDSVISGTFYSGKHYSDTWNASINDSFELTNPYEITLSSNKDAELEFTFPSVREGEIQFPSDKYQNKVTMIQIFGSWCPNCMDEVNYYSELYDRFNEEGLEIIAVGFETPKTLDKKKQSVRKLINHFDAKYDFAIGGKASKDTALARFPILNKVVSFPTTIFVDRQGNIAKVHTGFYGPGTGIYYQNYTREVETLISNLLKEGA